MPKHFILIAEDDADDRFLLQTAFSECGFNEELKFVENGVELIKYLLAPKSEHEAKDPLFILLDLNMPRKDGRESLKEIKENVILKHIPIIVFTTTKNETEIKRCYELGANSYIVKPPSFDELVHVIRSIHDFWVNIASTPI